MASLAANVAVAQPTVTGRVIAAWPSFALIGSYELLMRQVRRSAARPVVRSRAPSRPLEAAAVTPGRRVDRRGPRNVGGDLQRQAWQWAMANRAPDGSLPSGKAIAARYGRHERWGRLVKRTGIAGEFADAAG